MRVTLTDDGCTYEGDTARTPGLFDIEVENKTSHFAMFLLSALPPGRRSKTSSTPSTVACPSA